MILGWYNQIFVDIIGDVIQKHDCYRNYSLSSPVMGMSWSVNGSLLVGDSHFWAIWAGN